jgi:NADH-quinone oxidoreductase subunit I
VNPMLKDPVVSPPAAGVTGVAFGDNERLAAEKAARERPSPASPPAVRKAPVRYARKQYWNEPTMTWWEKAYLPEVLRGLAITTGIFLRNMGKWLTGRKGAVTTYYPEEKRADFAPRNRGKHILTQRPDGSPQCIACNMCATVCPAKVIEIEAGFDPNDPAHPKYPVRFEIDYSRCVFCGMCVEACPEDAIRMQEDVPDLVSDNRYEMWMTMEEMLSWRPQQDVAKPYPPKPVPLTLGESVKRGRGQ